MGYLFSYVGSTLIYIDIPLLFRVIQHSNVFHYYCCCFAIYNDPSKSIQNLNEAESVARIPKCPPIGSFRQQRESLQLHCKVFSVKTSQRGGFFVRWAQLNYCGFRKFSDLLQLFLFREVAVWH